ncbi:MAG: hypothetical protein J7497_10990, partial [Chitinophagaceae bacterium]|nr:hypothetical protein [Chitinophagaceae bacterium]
MKRYFLLLSLLLLLLSVFSQTNTSRWNLNKYIRSHAQTTQKSGDKPVINVDLIKEGGEFLRDQAAAISRNGRYCSYGVEGRRDYTIIQSTESEWKREVPGHPSSFFSGDNRCFIYKTNDSLCYLLLGKSEIIVTKGVNSYHLPADDDRNEWVAIEFMDKTLLLKNLLTGKEYRWKDVKDYSFACRGRWFCTMLDNTARELVVIDLLSNRTRHYENISGYQFHQTGRVLILLSQKKGEERVLWVNPTTGKEKEVWANMGNNSIVNYVLDNDASRVAFIAQSISVGQIHKSIWYYRVGTTKAVKKVGHNALNINPDQQIVDVPTFSDDGRHLVFATQNIEAAYDKKLEDPARVDVWSYKDTILMSAQIAGTAAKVQSWLSEKKYKFSISLDEEGSLSYLSGVYEDVLSVSGEFAVIRKYIPNDRFWEKWAKPKLYMTSTTNGERVSLREEIQFAVFAPDGSWLLCYDSSAVQYMRFDMGTRRYTNLARQDSLFFGEEDEFSGSIRQPALGRRGIVGWVNDGKALLVYDHYDIWQLDITGRMPAINLTNGRKNKIRFEITLDKSGIDGRTFYYDKDRLILTAVNMETMENGFYVLKLSEPG